MVSVVAHADDGNLTVFYQLYQFLHDTISTINDNNIIIVIITAFV